MVSLNKSFLYGICFASLTWIVSLYLYFQLTSQEAYTKNTIQPWAERSHPLMNGIMEESAKNYHIDKSHEKRYKKYNNKELIRKLQPVFSKPSEDLDEGLLLYHYFLLAYSYRCD